MNILLDGYFDKNFGDDLMQLCVVNALREQDFYVDFRQREMLAHLESCPNVHLGAAEEIHAYVRVTGTGFQYNRKLAAASKIYSNLLGKEKVFPKSAVIGCSLEPVRGRLSAYLTKNELRKFSLISCRDEKSFEYIKAACPKSRVERYADLGFAALGEYKAGGGTALGIIPARRTTENNYEYYKALARCGDLYAEETGGSVLIFAFDNGIENDASAAMSILKMMTRAQRAEVVIYNSDPHDFIKRLSGCGKIVSTRFHGIVSALALGIPCVGAADTGKLERLCGEFAVPSVKKAEAEGEKIFEALKTARPSEKAAAAAFSAQGHIELLREFLLKAREAER